MLEGATAAADERVDIPGIGVYDGDTAEPERRRVRAEARLVITNPDMLHASIVPQHRAWARVLRGLRQGVTLVPISAQLELTASISAQLKLTMSPVQPKCTRGCVSKVLKMSSNVSDVFPEVLKLSSEMSECKPRG